MKLLSPRHQKQTTFSAEHQPQSPYIEINELSLVRGKQSILSNIKFTIDKTGITSIIGPSGAGKSSLLRCINGLNSDWKGSLRVNEIDIKQWPKGEDTLRRHVGLIGQKPTVFPCSIADNVIFGVRGKLRKKDNSTLVEHCLKRAALWDEVYDRLDSSAETLSLGQQQRLCIARALAVEPAILLLDEPTASLDPRSKNKIEASLHKLAKTMPIVIVTHDLDQLSRLDGQIIFMCDGKLIEQGSSEQLLNRPRRVETKEFFQWSMCDCPPEQEADS